MFTWLFQFKILKGFLSISSTKKPSEEWRVSLLTKLGGIERSMTSSLSGNGNRGKAYLVKPWIGLVPGTPILSDMLAGAHRTCC